MSAGDDMLYCHICKKMQWVLNTLSTVSSLDCGHMARKEKGSGNIDNRPLAPSPRKRASDKRKPTPISPRPDAFTTRGPVEYKTAPKVVTAEPLCPECLEPYPKGDPRKNFNVRCFDCEQAQILLLKRNTTTNVTQTVLDLLNQKDVK